MNSFVTGSYVYGTPSEDSDIDLVIMTDEMTAKWLHSMLNEEDFQNSDTPAFGSVAIRHGKLNLICCWHEWVYALWLTGTSALALKKPVTREQACRLFGNLRMGDDI